MSKGVLIIVVAVAISTAGCRSSQPAVTAGNVAAAEPPIAKGLVRDGLYVNKSGVPLCPVTGAPIAKGKEVGKTIYKGVEYHFCCAGCPEDFKSQPAKYAFK